MIVLFWSPTPGHGKVTSTAVANACTIALEYKSKVLMIDAKGSGDLTSSFGSLRDMTKRTESGEGLRGIKRLMSSGKLDSKGVADSAVYYLDGKLDVLNTDGESEEDLNRVIPVALNYVRDAYDVTVVDGGSPKSDEDLGDLVKHADLVVTCLPQNMKMVSRQAKRIMAVVKDKPWMIGFGDFETSSALSTTKLANLLGVNKKDVGVVPKSVAFMDAIGKENILEFFIKNAGGSKSIFKMSDEEVCTSNVSSFSKRILQKSNVVLEKENAR